MVVEGQARSRRVNLRGSLHLAGDGTVLTEGECDKEERYNSCHIAAVVQKGEHRGCCCARVISWEKGSLFGVVVGQQAALMASVKSCSLSFVRDCAFALKCRLSKLDGGWCKSRASRPAFLEVQRAKRRRMPLVQPTTVNDISLS